MEGRRDDLLPQLHAVYLLIIYTSEWVVLNQLATLYVGFHKVGSLLELIMSVRNLFVSNGAQEDLRPVLGPQKTEQNSSEY